MVTMSGSDLDAVYADLEAASVIFIETNSEGPGVRLWKSGQAS